MKDKLTAALMAIGVLMILVSAVKCRYDQTQDVRAGRTVTVIEGCEYLTFTTYLGYEGVTHKGNCTNHGGVK